MVRPMINPDKLQHLRLVSDVRAPLAQEARQLRSPPDRRAIGCSGTAAAASQWSTENPTIGNGTYHADPGLLAEKSRR